MNQLQTLFAVHFLTNKVPVNNTTTTVGKGLIQCSGLCGRHTYGCLAFKFDSGTSQCTLTDGFQDSSAPPTKYYIKNDPCPIVDGYISLKKQGENLCIKFYSYSMKNWPNAQADCVARGDNLVTLNSGNKILLLYEYMINKPNFNRRWWIGLKDADNTNTYRWPDGTVVSSTYWGDTQPDFTSYGKDDDCVILGDATSLFKWSDYNCPYNNLSYICEKKI